MRNSQSAQIPRPLLLHSKHPQLKRLPQHRPRRRRDRVLIPTQVQDKRTQTEHDRGQQESQPEPDVFLRVDHGDRARQGTDVDHAVEVQEDAGDGVGWVDDDALAGFGQLFDVRLSFFVLFGD